MTLTKLSSNIRFSQEIDKINEVIDELNSGVAVIVDTELNESSPNPVQNAIITTALGSLSELSTDSKSNIVSAINEINSFAGVSLGNPWIQSYSLLYNNFTFELNQTYENNLSSYLPNDGAQYEVMVLVSSVTAGNLLLDTDIFSNIGGTLNSNGGGRTQIIAPVGVGRTLTFIPHDSNSVGVWVELLGYRKVTGGGIAVIDSALSESSTNPVQNAVITAVLGDLSELSTDSKTDIVSAINEVNSFAGVSLGNPWIGSHHLFYTDATIEGNSEYTVNLSSYLPNDGAQYEILFLLSGIGGNIVVTSDICTTIVGGLFENSSDRDRTQLLIPIGTGRYAKLNTYTSESTTNVYFEAVAYRKVTGGGIAVIDSALSETSTNPVQNAVITSALNSKQPILTAGNGISISDENVISVLGGTAEWGNIQGTLSEQSDLIEVLELKQDLLTAGSGISISDEGVISNTQTSAEWGNIIGTLSEQTDLVEILDLKQDILTAGSGISISEDNIVSTIPYTAGEGISINNNVISGVGNFSYSDSSPALTPSNGIITWSITHNLGTSNIICNLYYGNTEVEKNVEIVSDNAITLTFRNDTATEAGAYRVVIVSCGGLAPNVNYDGQWVNKTVEIFRENDRPLTTDENISLTSYLPIDTDEYEILISFSHYKNANQGQQFVEFSTDLISHMIAITNLNSTTARFLAGNTMLVPVGTSRSLIVHGYDWCAKGELIITLYGYKKLGYGRNNNGMTNTSLSNINNEAKSIISSMGTPSTTSIELEISASGSTYTAPSDGYFAVTGVAGTNATIGWIYMTVEAKNMRVQPSNSSQNGLNGVLPVSKGDVMYLEYYNWDEGVLKFIYNEGSKHEYVAS